ncbi:hypothetical protein FHS47_000694 [Lutibacter sp. SG786]|nr:hypothetical protein [Luteibacter sp. SG786]
MSRARRAPTIPPSARETIRDALCGSRLRRRSRGSGPSCREHPSPLKRLPHKAKRLPQEHDATVSQRPHLPSCLRKQAPSASPDKMREQPSAPAPALPPTPRTVRCQYPFPSPRCLESRVAGRKRPEGGRPGWPAVFAEAGRRVEAPPPGRPGPPRRSHKTLAAQRLSVRKERRKSSRRGERVLALKPRHRRRERGRKASQTYEANPTLTPRYDVTHAPRKYAKKKPGLQPGFSFVRTDNQ